MTLVLAAAGAANAAAPRRTDESVAGFFTATRDGDRKLYKSVAPRIVLMAAPDFGFPVTWAEAQEIFAKCEVLTISPETDAAGMDRKGFKSSTARVSCPSPELSEPFDIEFIGWRGKLVVAYPGNSHSARD